MNVFSINLLLAFAWAAAVGDVSPASLVIGFFVGFAALWTLRPLFREDSYFLRLPRLIRLAGLFLWELVVSSARVAVEILRPFPRARPGIVAAPMRVTDETGVLLLSSLVTLTPGTLSLDVSEDGRTLFIHTMFLDDPDALRAELRDGMEARVLEALE
jgi:multicomponent Na+:H+ antiporter subunit E